MLNPEAIVPTTKQDHSVYSAKRLSSSKLLIWLWLTGTAVAPWECSALSVLSLYVVTPPTLHSIFRYTWPSVEYSKVTFLLL